MSDQASLGPISKEMIKQIQERQHASTWVSDFFCNLCDEGLPGNISQAHQLLVLSNNSSYQATLCDRLRGKAFAFCAKPLGGGGFSPEVFGSPALVNLILCFENEIINDCTEENWYYLIKGWNSTLTVFIRA
jgi:hypothetical protein